MTLAQRRWLLISFTVFFSVFSPLLILYASGYRYNTRLRKIEQVGLLSLSSPISHITATINGVVHPMNGELLLSTMPVHNEEIILSKDGYHSWKKNLSIESGRTTFAREIWLFPDMMPDPIELFTNPLTVLAQSSTRTVLAAPQGLVSFQPADHALLEADLPQGDVPVTQANLLGDIVVFLQGTTWYSVDLAAETLTVVPLILPEQTNKVIVGDSVLFALTKDRVWEWKAGASSPLFDLDESQTIRQVGKRWYVIAAEATHKRSFLYEVSDANARPQFIIAFPYSDSWSISDVRGTLLTIHDDAGQNLNLVDTRISPPAAATFNGVFAWEWSKDGRALLAATQNELSIYRLENGTTQELLLRQSQPITSIDWSTDESWIFYTSDDSVYAIERDDRNGRNIIALATKKTAPKLLGATTDELLFSSQEQSSFVIWVQALSNE